MRGERAKRFIAPVVALLAAGSLAACGSSSSSSITGTAATKASYIAQADAICQSAQAQLKPIQAKVKRESTGNRQALAKALDQAAGVASSALAKLRALTPPQAGRTLAERYIAGAATQTALIRELGNALHHNNVGAAARLSRRINEGSVRVRHAARAYGFKVCANPTG